MYDQKATKGISLLAIFVELGSNTIEIGLEHAHFVVLVFPPHLNMQKPADHGPQQH